MAAMDSNVQWLWTGLGLVLLVGIAGWLVYRQGVKVRRAREALAAAEAQRQAAAEQARRQAEALALARQRAQLEADLEAARVAREQAVQAEAQRAAAEAARAAAAAEARRAAAAAAAHRAAAQAQAEQAAHARAAAAQAAAQREAERLAAERAALAAARAAARAAKRPEETLVLVVDDSRTVRVKTGRLLGAHGYQVSFANDGLDAVRLLQESQPDIVITDVEMPGMDGFELTRHVRKDARSAHLPIIMITSADERHREDARAAGVSVLLGKPFGDEELIAHIRKVMNGCETQVGALA